MGYEDVDLIEPIDVTIAQIDKVATPFHDSISGKREPANTIVRKTVVIPAQVVFGKTPSDEQLTFIRSMLGPDESIRGYMIVSRKDLNAKGISLKRGDKIVQVGDFPVEVYLAHSTNDPSSHFSSTGTFSLLKVFFIDRNPVGGEMR